MGMDLDTRMGRMNMSWQMDELGEKGESFSVGMGRSPPARRRWQGAHSNLLISGPSAVER